MTDYYHCLAVKNKRLKKPEKIEEIKIDWILNQRNIMKNTIGILLKEIERALINSSELLMKGLVEIIKLPLLIVSDGVCYRR